MYNTNLQVYGEIGEQFLCTKQQADTLDLLKELNRGGIGTIHGYVPSSGYDISPELDIQVITRISTEALYKRKIEALDAISFADIKDDLPKTPKLAELPIEEARKLFDQRKQMLVDSMNKTLAGDRSDAMREGHDRNNISICHGVKVNLEGKKVDGIKVPTLHYSPTTVQPLPKCETILLMCLEISRTVVREGVYKTVNSGAPVLIGNLIESKLNKRSVGLKSFSLDPSKFKSLVIAKKTISKQDLVDATKDLTMVEMILYLLEEYEK